MWWLVTLCGVSKNTLWKLYGLGISNTQQQQHKPNHKDQDFDQFYKQRQDFHEIFLIQKMKKNPLK